MEDSVYYVNFSKAKRVILSESSSIPLFNLIGKVVKVVNVIFEKYDMRVKSSRVKVNFKPKFLYLSVECKKYFSIYRMILELK